MDHQVGKLGGLTPTQRSTGSFYRRSPRLVAYWRGGRFIIHPYRSGPAYAADPALVRLLDGLSAWTRLETSPALDRLVRQGLIEQAARPARDRETAWDRWGHAAAFLHYSTCNRDFLSQRRTNALVAERLHDTPPPPPIKTYRGRALRPLPAIDPTPFDALLRDRRTWRRFGRAPLGIDDLSGVLHTTFAVQRWADLGRLGRVMLRSSPSGGARHPIEAYVLARRVAGLPNGAYHYAPHRHALTALGGRITRRGIVRMLAGQPWYGAADAVVVLTAVLARKAWAYPHARAYRSLLLEAGHFCQTFCLAATDRALAPFCTGAFYESAIEDALGLDEGEPVLYVAGLGTRPRGVRWAPLPHGESGLGE